MTEQEMMKEALEWKEHIRKLVTATDDELYHKRSKVFDWLIQQAERVQELEELLLQNKYDKALYEKKVIEWLELKEENKRYREALEFYADEEHYKEKLISEAQYDADGICISNDEYAPPIIYFDNGEKARQALKGETK